MGKHRWELKIFFSFSKLKSWLALHIRSYVDGDVEDRDREQFCWISTGHDCAVGDPGGFKDLSWLSTLGLHNHCVNYNQNKIEDGKAWLRKDETFHSHYDLSFNSKTLKDSEYKKLVKVRRKKVIWLYIMMKLTSFVPESAGYDVRYTIYYIIYINWGASPWWLSSQYCPIRNSEQMTIGKTHPTLQGKIQSYFVQKCIEIRVK